MDESQVEEMLALGAELFHACLVPGNIDTVQKFVDNGYPTWFQDPESGWSILHAAAAIQDEGLIRLLLKSSAIWNAGKP